MSCTGNVFPLDLRHPLLELTRILVGKDRSLGRLGGEQQDRAADLPHQTG